MRLKIVTLPVVLEGTRQDLKKNHDVYIAIIIIDYTTIYI